MNVVTITEQILRKMSGIGKVQQRFFISMVSQWLYQRGRYCFDNMVRQGFMNAMSYRLNFDKFFDFKRFNHLLIEAHASSELIICFDPSYISKSGKHTYGIGYFWSGCAQAVKKGLEISSIAIGDVLNHTAFHYYAQQTVLSASESLMDFYINCIVSQAKDLARLSKYVVVDAYFAKFNFINAVTTNNLHVITRLRDDASLWYLYQGMRTNKRGRPTKYQGKVSLQALDMAHFTCFESTTTHQAFQAIVFSKSLKTTLQVVVVHFLKKQQVKAKKIFACTDITLPACKIWLYYRLRFQEEFLFRDAKQALGLTHCQSRQKDRLHFHFNLCLTVLSIAKVVHWISVPILLRQPFSIQDIKTQYINEHLLNKFISVMGICPITTKNSDKYRQLINYTKIAA